MGDIHNISPLSRPKPTYFFRTSKDFISEDDFLFTCAVKLKYKFIQKVLKV